MILTEDERKYMIGTAVLELGVVFVLIMIILEGKLDVSMSYLFITTIMLLVALAFLELFTIYIIHKQPLTIPE